MTEITNIYMKRYRSKSPKVVCDICGNKFKKIDKYKHIKTKGHMALEKFKSSFLPVNNLNNI